MLPVIGIKLSIAGSMVYGFMKGETDVREKIRFWTYETASS